MWDARALRGPVSTIFTGGGLWRLKWHPDPDRGNLLLAACMHAGVSIVNTVFGVSEPFVSEKEEGPPSEMAAEDVKGEIGIVAKYTRHKSMAYGADWCRSSCFVSSKRAVVASCSFYDNLLCLWRAPPLWV